MDAFIWGERFFTGLSVVDEQHQRLVELINQYGELSAQHEVTFAQLEPVLDELARYAQTHFADEEALMDGSGVDARFVEHHKQTHLRFLNDVGAMRSAALSGTAQNARALFRFLVHWLASHILGTDMQLARQLARVRQGESAADAYAAEVHDVEKPTQLLLGAVDDLMRVISERNAELTEANRTLEERVALRTAELTSTVERLRATQVQLVETEKLASVGQLASGLAHEINNPLGFVAANLSAFEEHTSALHSVLEVARGVARRLGPEDRDLFDRACDEADLEFVEDDLPALLKETREGVKRVQAIVHDLKDFSNVDAGDVIDVNLASSVEVTLKVLPPRHRDHVTFVTELALTPRVRCQASSVNQALLALVQNAAQAVQDKPGSTGRVTLKTGADETFAWVEILDDGVGMTAQTLAHAFEPFFTTRAPGQGIGLGLTTAYQCAQAHGGKLEATSEPGRGTSMRLMLPLRPVAVDTVRRDFSNAFNTRRYTGAK